MKATVTLGLAAVAALVAGGCASRAWTLGPLATGTPEPAYSVPPHRAVERVTLRIRGRELEFVAYRMCDSPGTSARVQLLLESGISVLDVSVDGTEWRRNSGSAFEEIPHFTETAIEDLLRVWGGRSIFSWHSGVGIMVGGIFWRSDGARSVSDGTETYAAYPVLWSYVALTPRASDPKAGHLRVTTLDEDLRPEATIEYADFDDDGVPREIHLVDLRDGHTLDVEVEEVTLQAEKPR